MYKPKELRFLYRKVGAQVEPSCFQLEAGGGNEGEEMALDKCITACIRAKGLYVLR